MTTNFHFPWKLAVIFSYPEATPLKPRVFQWPQMVKAYLEASVKGWNYYKDNYKDVNPVIKESNKDTPLEKMEFTDSIVFPLMFGGDAEKQGFGYMSKERWETLAKQLTDLGILKSMPDVSQVYTVDYLPKK